MEAQVLQLCPLPPGWRAAYAVEGQDPLFLDEIPCLALVQRGKDREVLPILREDQWLRTEGEFAGHMTSNYLGLVAPGEDLAPWRVEAIEWNNANRTRKTS